jgi:hypothetical protein
VPAGPALLVLREWSGGPENRRHRMLLTSGNCNKHNLLSN